MSFSKKMRAVKPIFAILALLVLTACGGGNDVSPLPVPTAVPEVIEATSTPVSPTAIAVIPTVIPTVVPAAAPTASPTATPTPTPVQTATPEPPQKLDEFGFVLTLDRGAYVNNLPGNTDAQGIVQLEYSGVNVILSWVPINGVTVEGLIYGTFDMLQDNQPDLTFDTVSESSFSVGIESGSVIGFKSVDASGDVAGGGLIGAWNCPDQQTSFTLMVTGADASIVQLRFNRLANNFSCA